MTKNEQGAVETYEEAVKDAIGNGLPENVVDTCRRALEDERRHLEFCQQARDRQKATELKRPAAARPERAPRTPAPPIGGGQRVQ